MVVWLKQCLLVLLPVLSVSVHQSSPMNDPGELVDLIMDKTDNVEVVVALDGSTMAGQDIGNRRMYGGETGVPVYVNNYGKEDHGPGRAGQEKLPYDPSFGWVGRIPPRPTQGQSYTRDQSRQWQQRYTGQTRRQKPYEEELRGRNGEQPKPYEEQGAYQQQGHGQFDVYQQQGHGQHEPYQEQSLYDAHSQGGQREAYPPDGPKNPYSEREEHDEYTRDKYGGQDAFLQPGESDEDPHEENFRTQQHGGYQGLYGDRVSEDHQDSGHLGYDDLFQEKDPGTGELFSSQEFQTDSGPEYSQDASQYGGDSGPDHRQDGAQYGGDQGPGYDQDVAEYGEDQGPGYGHTGEPYGGDHDPGYGQDGPQYGRDQGPGYGRDGSQHGRDPGPEYGHDGSQTHGDPDGSQYGRQDFDQEQHSDHEEGGLFSGQQAGLDVFGNELYFNSYDLGVSNQKGDFSDYGGYESRSGGRQEALFGSEDLFNPPASPIPDYDDYAGRETAADYEEEEEEVLHQQGIHRGGPGGPRGGPGGPGGPRSGASGPPGSYRGPQQRGYNYDIFGGRKEKPATQFGF